MNKPTHYILGLLLALFSILTTTAQDGIWLEAEGFDKTGGWKIDQQFIVNMGSPYLLAHGMGEPVEDATTAFEVAKAGNYYLWVRTKDWAPYPTGPGKFKVLLNGQPIGDTYGSSGLEGWQWYGSEKVKLEAGTQNLTLKDLTGFEGRVDALFLSKNKKFTPPNDSVALEKFRLSKLNLTNTFTEKGPYDFVVVGGGIAGTAAAVQAARLGLKTALIQDRPVLGGNNSSEIRVHLMGDIDKNHYPKLGRIVRELDNGDPGNSNPNARAYGDYRKQEVVDAEPKLDVYFSTFGYDVTMQADKITSVLAMDIRTNERLKIKGKYFADCTGDATIGYQAGADYRMGRESKDQTGEPSAVDEPDNFTMGFSNLWNAHQLDVASTFPKTPWALPFTDAYHFEKTRADWKWETGFGNFDPITQAEEIRDYNFRAIYGNWSYLKNNKAEKYKNWKLKWVAYIAGKRESRRLLGDLILIEQDLTDHKIYPDGFVTSTWDVDLHYPDPENSKYFKGQEFISTYEHPEIKPYPIPYRCLYSRNVPNLMMAGRNISVTHVALGTIRVMRTTGMMGELLGYATYLANKHNTTPRGVYENHLDELKALLK